MREFVISAHQPAMFPNNAFWTKMLRSDLFELAIYDQFSTRKDFFVNRMNLGPEDNFETFKLPLTIQDKPQDRICDVPLPENYQELVWDAIGRAYHRFPYWWSLHPAIKEMVFGTTVKLVWEFDFWSILRMRELLGIKTPVAISEPPPRQGRTEDLIWLVKHYNGTTYLSGQGGKQYIDESVFEEAGIQLKYLSGTFDRTSILTRIFSEGLECRKSLL